MNKDEWQNGFKDRRAQNRSDMILFGTTTAIGSIKLPSPPKQKRGPLKLKALSQKRPKDVTLKMREKLGSFKGRLRKSLGILVKSTLPKVKKPPEETTWVYISQSHTIFACIRGKRNTKFGQDSLNHWFCGSCSVGDLGRRPIKGDHCPNQTCRAYITQSPYLSTPLASSVTEHTRTGHRTHASPDRTGKRRFKV